MNNEVTLNLLCDINEFIDILKCKGFKKTDKYYLEDTYFVNKKVNLSKSNIEEILNSCILIRNIKQFMPKDFKKWNTILSLTYKHKSIASDGAIINQKKFDCEIKDFEQGENLLKGLGYRKLLMIKENDEVYSKEGFSIAIKDIINGDNLIEVEENSIFNTINKIKDKLSELNLPIDTNDYFVKKAEIELNKILKEY